MPSIWAVSYTHLDVYKRQTIITAMLPIMVVYPFLQKHFAQGMMLGAVKG